MLHLITSLILCSIHILASNVMADSNKIKVGVILPLSGETASMGEAMRNGISLAMNNLPTNIKNKIQFNFEDDALLAKNSISAFHKLTGHYNIDVLINASSNTGRALAPLAEQRQITFIAIASDSAISNKKNYVFNLWVTPDEEVRIAIPEALKRGYRKIARIGTTQDGVLAIKESFDRQNNGRLQLVLDEEYPPDIKDFRSFLTKLRGYKDLDAIMAVLVPGQCGIFARQARELGLHQDIFGFEIFEDVAEVRASAGALVGQWYVNTDDPDSHFIENYRKHYPNASLLAASNAHDAALLIAKAIEAGHNRSTFHEYLKNLNNFTGALGTYSASGDNTFTLPAAIKVVTEDGFKKVYQ